MALDQPRHHVGLARRAERRAGLGGLSCGDQRVDDVAALHQQAMHRFVDAVDLAAQVGKGGRRLGASAMMGVLVGPVRPKSKKTLAHAERQSGLDEASTVSLSVDHRRGQFEPVGLQATLNNLLKGRGVRNPALAHRLAGFLFGERRGAGGRGSVS
jgi:hypothetical protein